MSCSAFIYIILMLVCSCLSNYLINGASSSSVSVVPNVDQTCIDLDPKWKINEVDTYSALQVSEIPGGASIKLKIKVTMHIIWCVGKGFLIVAPCISYIRRNQWGRVFRILVRETTSYLFRYFPTSTFPTPSKGFLPRSGSIPRLFAYKASEFNRW